MSARAVGAAIITMARVIQEPPQSPVVSPPGMSGASSFPAVPPSAGGPAYQAGGPTNLLFPLPLPRADGWQPGSGLPPNVLSMSGSGAPVANSSEPGGRQCYFCKQNFTSQATTHLLTCQNAMQCRNCKEFCRKGGIQQHLANKCKAGGSKP